MSLGNLVQQVTGPRPRRALRRLWVRLRFVMKARRAASFLAYTGMRFLGDGGLRMAAGLSYASLLAMVPLLAIVLAVMSAIPTFRGIEQALLETVFQNFLPQAGAAIAEQVRGFVANASKLTGPGAIGLAITAILLLNNINGAFNAIWRVNEPRPVKTRVLVYWALLTLGPLLLGSSISLSSFVFAAVRMGGIDAVTSWLQLSRVISVTLSAAGFALIFFVVPNRRIGFGHAAAGGVVSALLFELLKYGFGLYLAHFPSYQAIYGAFSTVPIFLVWLFLSWCVVLLGAEVTAALPEWRAAQARGAAASSTGGRLALALALLTRLRAAMREGRHLKRHEAIRGLPATPAEIDDVMKPMREAGFLARTHDGHWLVGRDLTAVTLSELIDALGMSLEPGQGWPPPAAEAMRALAAASDEVRRRPLAEVLEGQGSRGQGSGG